MLFPEVEDYVELPRGKVELSPSGEMSSCNFNNIRSLTRNKRSCDSRSRSSLKLTFLQYRNSASYLVLFHYPSMSFRFVDDYNPIAACDSCMMSRHKFTWLISYLDKYKCSGRNGIWSVWETGWSRLGNSGPDTRLVHRSLGLRNRNLADWSDHVQLLHVYSNSSTTPYSF